MAPFAEVFGWTAQTEPTPVGPYTVFKVQGGNPDGIAGAMSPPMETPSFWGVYFTVDDTSATVAAANEHGATVMMDAMEMPDTGTLATMVDPQGAVFSIMQPEG